MQCSECVNGVGGNAFGGGGVQRVHAWGWGRRGRNAYRGEGANAYRGEGGVMHTGGGGCKSTVASRQPAWVSYVLNLPL